MNDPNTLWPNVIEGLILAFGAFASAWWGGRCLIQAAKIVAGHDR